MAIEALEARRLMAVVEVGTDFRISSVGPDGNVAFDAQSPALAYNPTANEYLAVWSADDNGTDNEFEIYGQRINAANGALIGAEIRISSMGPDGDVNFGAFEPAIAYNSAADEYLVVWSGDDDTAPLVNDEFEIFGQRLSSAGVEVGGDFRISDMGPDGSTAYGAFTPAVAANPISNEYVVVWQGDDDTAPLVDNELEIFGQRLTAAGVETGTDFRISVMGPNGSINFGAFTPDIVHNATGNQYLVVWRGDDDTAPLVDDEFEIFGQRLSAAAALVGGEIRVSAMGTNGNTNFGAFTPAVAYNIASDEYLVVWSGDDDTAPLVNDELEIFGQRLTAAGVATGTDDFRISDMGPDGNTAFAALAPDVVYNATADEYLVVWSGDDDTAPLVNNELEIFGQQIDADGSAIDVDFRISNMGPDGSTAFAANAPAVAFGSTSNEYLAVWEGDDDTPPLVDDELEIFGQRLSIGTTLTSMFVAPGVLMVPGSAGSDTFFIELDPTATFIRIYINPVLGVDNRPTTPPTNTFAKATVQQINVQADSSPTSVSSVTGGGNDRLIVDSLNGLIDIAQGIHFNGELGFDSLAVQQNAPGVPLTAGGLARDSEILALGATPGSGVSTLISGAVRQHVFFENLEPLAPFIVPAATFSITSVPGVPGMVLNSLLQASNAINYEDDPLAGFARVTVDNFEPIIFTNKDRLIIDAGAGSDMINLNNADIPNGMAPATLMGTIEVNGNDPTASDTLIVNGTTDSDPAAGIQQDGFDYRPATADSGEVRINDGPPAVINLPTVVFNTIEHVIINGLGGNDALTVTTPAVANTISLSPGPAVDAGEVLIDGLTPMSFKGLGAGGALGFVDLAAAPSDVLVYNGTNANDQFAVAATTGTVSLTTTLGQYVQTATLGIVSLRLNGLAGDDAFTINTPLPARFTSLLVNGGEPSGSDNVTIIGTAGNDAIGVNFFSSLTPPGLPIVGGSPAAITVTGLGPAIGLVGDEHVNIDGGGGAADTLVVTGSAEDDRITYTPTNTDAPLGAAPNQRQDEGVFTNAGFNAVFTFDRIEGAFTIAGGTAANADEVIVQGTNGRDEIRVDATTRTATVIDRFLPAAPVTLKGVALAASIETLTVQGRSGDDSIRIIPALPTVAGSVDNLRIFVDGGSPSASDALVIERQFTGMPADRALLNTDFVIVNRGREPNSGVVRIFRSAVQMPDISYVGTEIVSPNVAAANVATNLLILGPDLFEPNENFPNAADLGSGTTLNVQHLSIFPGDNELPGVPADQDFFRVVADATGTLDFQVRFRMFATNLLPGGGDLDIEVYDGDGTLIVDGLAGGVVPEFGLNDTTANERIRIPAVAGQTYYLRVFGKAVNADGTANAAQEVNGYDLTVINAPALVPYGLELDDNVALGTVTAAASTTQFDGDLQLSSQDAFYVGKRVTFTSGALIGQQAIVTTYVGASRTFTLVTPLSSVPVVGDFFIVESFDTGRSQFDNVTRDDTPQIFLRLDDAFFLQDLPGNPAANAPPDEVIPIPFRSGPNLNLPGYAIAVFDEGPGAVGATPPQMPLGFAFNVGDLNSDGDTADAGEAFVPGVYKFTVPDALSLTQGSHFLSARVQMIDPAMPQETGFGGRSLLLEVVVDTQPPSVFFGFPDVVGDGLIDESGVPGQLVTFNDGIVNTPRPTFWGTAEANAEVVLFADVDNNGMFGPADRRIAQTVAIPLDGTNQQFNGRWRVQSDVSLNDPAFFPFDGQRRVFAFALDPSGNAESPFDTFDDAQQISVLFIDTQPPIVASVTAPGVDLTDPKPDAPTPNVNTLQINFEDLPTRIAALFNYLAVNEVLAENVLNYSLVGDATGAVTIVSAVFTDDTPVPVVGQPERGHVILTFAEPLPDDRYTLTVFDRIQDNAGNALDGERDGVAGDNFVFRFTIDSRPEIGSWAAGSVYIDLNGNLRFDPDNPDPSNRDVTHTLGLTTDYVFAGKFVGAGNPFVANGFDGLAVFGHEGGVSRWQIDTTGDGVPDLFVGDGPSLPLGVPVAGNFDGNAANGDEVGIFTGTHWILDNDRNFMLSDGDPQIAAAATMRGLPFVGDFNKDGAEDFGTYNFVNNTFFVSTTGPGGAPTAFKIQFHSSFIGGRERPVVADMNNDGFDDLGLWVPDRRGITPRGTAEWYILVSQNVAGDATVESVLDRATLGGGLVPFRPAPFGKDFFARFGDEFALPVLGNFDPPLGSDQSTDPPNTPPPANPAPQVNSGNDFVVIGADAGAAPTVRLLDRATGELRIQLDAYASDFRGGVRVTTADLNNDGVLDIITGAGLGGGPHVRAFDGRNGSPLVGPLSSFMAFNPAFRGGVSVATGDVNGDNRDDLIVAAGTGGGPHVKVFSGADGSLLGEFFAYDAAFRGGVNVAAGDVDGDGRAEIITGAGPGGGPHVRVFENANGLPFGGPGGSFFAYDAQFRGGVFVAAGDIDGDGRADIITGAGAGGGSHVRSFRASTGQEMSSFFAYANFTGGVRVATTDLNGDRVAELVLAPDAGNAQRVRITNSSGQVELAGYAGLPGSGAFVAAPRGALAQVAIAAPPPMLAAPVASPSSTTATDQVLSTWTDPAVDAAADALLGATVYPTASAARQARLRASRFMLL